VSYRQLNPDEIVTTLEMLQQRIAERFPESHLAQFCKELVQVAHKAVQRSRWIRKPLLPLRLGLTLLVAGLVGVLIFTIDGISLSRAIPDVGELLQSLEAALSSIVLLGAAMFFLLTLEIRVKRRRALKAIYELRAMVHIVDMHQLTKDPMDPRLVGTKTVSSPDRRMTAFELSRYLDYCSELLAMIGKIGALYVHEFTDSVVISAVDGLQHQTDGITQKIWHKMRIVDRIIASEEVAKASRDAAAPGGA
jgi:hypothetical protein